MNTFGNVLHWMDSVRWGKVTTITSQIKTDKNLLLLVVLERWRGIYTSPDGTLMPGDPFNVLELR